MPCRDWEFFNRRDTGKKSREIILCDSLRLCGSKIFTAEAQRKFKRKKLCDSLRLCGSMILTAETQRKFKRKKLCDSLRLCGSMILTAEAQRTHRAKKRYQGIHNWAHTAILFSFHHRQRLAIIKRRKAASAKTLRIARYDGLVIITRVFREVKIRVIWWCVKWWSR